MDEICGIVFLCITTIPIWFFAGVCGTKDGEEI
jgi:hypothetical protein